MTLRLAWLLLVACAASGCASLADRIVAPPSHGVAHGLLTDVELQRLGVTSGRWRSPGGITLAYRTIPAARRGMTYRYARLAHGGRFTMDGDWSPTAPLPRPRDTLGTIVYLHGWGEDGDSMLAWALLLADRGYRGMTVDLRNAGDSSRAPEGFGPREAADVVALLRHLQAQGQLIGPVTVFGVSFGASTALFAEQALRGQLAGIVAMAPFANAADAIRTMVPAMQHEMESSRMARVAMRLSGSHYDPASIEQAITEADRRLELDLAAIDLHAPVAQSHTCTLLLHGGRDTWIPAAASRGLAAQAASTVHYVELPDEDHLSLPARIDWLAGPLADWLAGAAQGRCAGLTLPADPAGAVSTR